MSMDILVSEIAYILILSEIQKQLLLPGFPEKHRWLQDELGRMQCFLKDDHLRDNGIDEVRRMAYDAEDMISNFLLASESKWQKKDILILVGHKYKQWVAKKRIMKYAGTMERKLRLIHQSGRSREESSEPPLSPNQIIISEIVGLKDETDEVVNQITGQERSIITVVGMGGLGKSTLARNVLNRDDVKNAFNLIAWVRITRKFNYREEQVEILRNTEDPISRTTENLDEFLESLRRNQNRFLLVLDDVWDGRLLEIFPAVTNGSKILITTRMNDVALEVGTHSVVLKHLDEEKSWDLFCKKASISPNERAFQDIGKKIVTLCGGLPLSIVSMAEKFKNVTRRRPNWEKAYKELELKDCKLENDILIKLETSYHELSPELKSCFLRLAFFPANYTIPAQKLIQLWIAEGLISKQDGGGIEATAESYLEMLVERNMVQVHPTDVSPDGKIKSCRIDNSLRELSIIKAKKEIYLEIHKDNKFQPESYNRHRAIHHSTDKYFDSQNTTSRLRSLLFIVPNGRISLPQLKFLCKTLKFLKVLHLEGMIVGSLPNEVGNLRYLTYLNLRNTSLDTLQPSMSNLKELLTFDIRDNMSVTNLNVINDMTNLQNLYLPGFYEGLTTFDGLCKLHKLKWVQLKSIDMSESMIQMNELRKLRVQLEGLLSLDDFLGSAKELKQLESLNLYPNIEISSLATDKFQFLTTLTKLYIKGGVRELPSYRDFPPKLMHLTLDGLGLIPFPFDELEKLPKLSILRLRNMYIKDEKLSFAADGFLRLKYLELMHLWNLKVLELRREGALKRLQHLKISNCTALESLPTDMQNLIKLSELHIDSMKDTFEKKIQQEWEHQDRVHINYTNTLKSYEDM